MKTIVVDLTKPYQEIEIIEDTEILGLFEGHGDDQIKASLDIVHKKPHLTSRVAIKAVVFNQAKFDLEAKMVIEKGATQTDSYLKVDALMMSDGAKARAVPSLEIYEDNVKGGHGATVGQVNKDQIHYLRSRGFSEQAAEELIVDAFIVEIRSRIEMAK